VRNAVDQAQRELRTRFDFKGVEAEIVFEESGILLSAPEDFQLKQLKDILRDKMVARGVDSRYLLSGTLEGVGKVRRQILELRQGIDRDAAKSMVKLVKDSKLKVQAQINGEKLRVTGKKKDDLQKTMAVLKEASFELPIRFDNFKD
jgi:hypothetical protein